MLTEMRKLLVVIDGPLDMLIKMKSLHISEQGGARKNSY